jgi:hypothetical protein
MMMSDFNYVTMRAFRDELEKISASTDLGELLAKFAAAIKNPGAFKPAAGNPFALPKTIGMKSLLAGGGGAMHVEHPTGALTRVFSALNKSAPGTTARA